jgi:hypothetical protein
LSICIFSYGEEQFPRMLGEDSSESQTVLKKKDKEVGRNRLA